MYESVKVKIARIQFLAALLSSVGILAAVLGVAISFINNILFNEQSIWAIVATSVVGILVLIVTLSLVLLQFKAALRVLVAWAVSALIDVAFFVLWLLIQWATYKLMSNLVSGIDGSVLVIFQALFAISTLVPVLVYIYSDLRMALLQIQRAIRKNQD